MSTGLLSCLLKLKMKKKVSTYDGGPIVLSSGGESKKAGDCYLVSAVFPSCYRIDLLGSDREPISSLCRVADRRRRVRVRLCERAANLRATN